MAEDPWAAFREPAAPSGGAGNDPWADFREQPSPGAGSYFARSAIDVGKQIPSGLIAGVEAIPAFPAHAANLISDFATPYIEKAADWIMPGKGAQMQEADRQRKERMAAFQQLRGGGVSDYLPKPETTAGQFARTGAEFIPAAVAGSRIAVPRAVGVGATTGLVSEAGGLATEGTALEPYARVGGALVAGHMAGRLAQGAATKSAIKSVSEGVRQEADDAYKQFRAAGFGIHPDEAVKYSRDVRSELYQGGRTDVTAPDTWKALEGIEGRPFTTPQDYQAAYQTLGNVAKDAGKSSDRLAAKIAQERLLGVLEDMKPSSVVSEIATGADPRAAVAGFQKANQDWAALMRAENVSGRINKAELKAGSTYSGLNLENQLRQRVGVLADPNVGRGFSPAEQAEFAKFAKGTLESNARRYAKNILGGGGGLGALAAGGLAGGSGAYFGLDPLSYGGAATLAGLGLAKYGNMRALNRARELELMLLQRSPYAARAGGPGTQAGGALSTLAPTLATIGQ